MPTATVSLPVLPANRPMRLTPTDVSQFVRLEQCERFLRFRLAERAGQKFMEEYDVIPQRITPLLSLSGHEFEEGIEKALGKRLPHRPLRRQVRPGPQPPRQQRGGRRRGPQAQARQVRPAVPAPPGGRTARLAAAGRRGPRAAGAASGRHPARPDRRHEIHRRGQGRTPPPGRLLPPDAGATASRTPASATQPVQTGILFRPPADPTPEEEEEIKPLRGRRQAGLRPGRRPARSRRRPASLPPVGPRSRAGQGLHGPPSGRHPVRDRCPSACPSSATAACTTNSA